MPCHLSEQDLWSGLDRKAPELQDHLDSCPTCRDKATAILAGVRVVTDAANPVSPPLPEQIGPYLIRRRLGEGGMGIVYEAEHPQTKRSVAIKVVRGGPHVDEYRVRLFQREAQTLARLRHPAIAAVYDAGRTSDGQHFFAMEHVHGRPLMEYVKSNDVARPERLRLFRRICDAIHYAHLRGVIHRDIKPSNILVDQEGQPKILDFGLARITDPDTAVTATGTEFGRFMGTIPYMSPEEVGGDPGEIDLRSDVYSLGVVFYELLTGCLPYTANKVVLHEAVRTICEVAPRRPSSVDRSLRGDLETITLKALEKDRARRYQSAAALAEDIERFQEDQPILARRAGAMYRFRKLVVRQKLFFVLLAAILLILGAAGVVVLQISAELRAGVELNTALIEKREAIIERKLAEARHTNALSLLRDRDFDGADSLLRIALQSLELLGAQARALDVKLELAHVQIARVESDSMAPDSDRFMREAESLLLETLTSLDELLAVDRASYDQADQALEYLIRLYGPSLYDYPEGLEERRTELANLRREWQQQADVSNALRTEPQ